jgi:hypothetical protein
LSFLKYYLSFFKDKVKSLPDGKMGICMLTVDLVSVSKKPISADVVTICMLLHQYVIPTITCRSRVRLPFTNQCDSSADRATDNHVGSSPTVPDGDLAELVNAKH